MNATAIITFDQQYYDLMYAESIRYRTGYRRVAIPIALLILGLGIASVIWLPSSLLGISLSLLTVGVIDIIETTTHRFRWMKKVLSQKRSPKAKLQFTEFDVHMDSDYSHGSIRYEGFHPVVTTPKGIFLVPHSGYSIFVPLATIEATSVVDSLVTHLITKVNVPLAPATPV